MYRKGGHVMSDKKVELKIGDVVLVIIDNRLKAGVIYDIDNEDDYEIRVADNPETHLSTFSAWVSYESVVKVNGERRN
jgi:hypothetical protein